MDNFAATLEEYKGYTELFAKQVSCIETWKEQTGCELEDEYLGYVDCCERRIYNFSTWYEHTRALNYPEGGLWDEYADHKFSLWALHP